MTARLTVFLALLFVLLNGCATEPDSMATTETAETMTVTGALTYRERMALPPGATARVTLSDVSIADRAAPVLAEQSIDLAGRQVPIGFSLDLTGDGMTPRGRYALRGTVVDDAGRLLWTTDTAHLIDPTTQTNDLGELMMVRAAAAGSSPPTPRLQGGEWVVEDIGGRGLIDYSRVTLNFGNDGRLSGRASCNSYSAAYEVSGETLSIGQAIATLRACAPALANQERKFLRILAEVERFEFSDTGALALMTGSGETLTARR